MGSLEEAIAETQRILKPIFSKPKCTTKLLTKPPFRFLHDIVTATLKSTGFPQKLYTSVELDSKQFKDKESKLKFFDKLIRLVSLYEGTTLKVRSSKIVAGAEPHHTNGLLAGFGRAATDSSLDRESLIKRCIQGNEVNEPSKSENHDEKSPNRKNEKVKQPSADDDEKVNDWETKTDDQSSGIKDDAPSVQATQEASSSMEEQVNACNEDPEKTRQMMEQIVTKPRCTDKLLSRPPFRFLHDLIMAVGKATGFGLNRYSNEEMDSSNIKDKSSKIEFLQKTIDHVESVLDTKIDAKPTKIVSGLEPEKTCKFLQLLALAVTLKEKETNDSHETDTPDGQNSVHNSKSDQVPLNSNAAPVVQEQSESKTQRKQQEEIATTPVKNEEPNKEEIVPSSQPSADDEKVNDSDSKTDGQTDDIKADTPSVQAKQEVSSSIEQQVNACNEDPERTRQMMEPIVTKPRCTDKLLSRPPFRFLHDLIMAVVKTTGVGLNIYNNEEMDSSNIKDKSSKIEFLQKTINHVESVLNTTIDAKPNKIVSGLEPEKTCKFLQLLALAVTLKDKETNDSHETDTPDGQNSVLGSKSDHVPSNSNEAPVVQEQSDSKTQHEQQEEIATTPVKDEEPNKEEIVPSSQPNVDDEKVNDSDSKTDGQTDDINDDSPPIQATQEASSSIEQQVNACNEDQERTRQMMEKIVSKPRCSDKLLSRPPFRFLHDLIMAVVKTTGFGLDVFNNEEMDSSKVKDKSSKIEFLQKTINHVESVLCTTIDAKPNKIVSGLDPEKTCKFLQLLALAVTLRGGKTNEGGETNDSHEKDESNNRNARPSVQFNNELNADTQDQDTEIIIDSHIDDQPHRKSEIEEKPDVNHEIEVDVKLRSMRPTTARRRPPRVKKVAPVEPEGVETSTMKATILKDGDDANDFFKEELVSKIDHERVGEKHLAEQIFNTEEHTALVQKIVREQENDKLHMKKDDETKTEKTGIRLHLNIKKKGVASSSAPIFNSNNYDFLIDAVQRLVQSTAPLGKCMDHLQDDIGQIIKEEEYWKLEQQQKIEELEAARKYTEESLEPLRHTIRELDEQMREKIQSIQDLKSKISKNDLRVRQLLNMVISS